MSKRRLLFAVVLGTVIVVLGGASYAVSDARSSAQSRDSETVGRGSDSRVPGLTQAYGVLVPPCAGCGLLRKGHTPLVRGASMNVALAPTRVGAPEGAWCFALEGHLNATEVTVVVSTLNTGGPYRHHYVLESAQWVTGASACTRGSRNQIEIQATGIVAEGGKLVAVPDHEAAFSFTVNAR